MLGAQRIAVLGRESLDSYLYKVPYNSVVYYPGFPGSGATVTDYSAIGSNDGTLTNVTWSVLPSGLLTRVFDGDANKYVRKASPTGLSGNTACTLKCWVNLAEIGARQSLIFFGQTGNNTNIWLELGAGDLWRLRSWDVGVIATGTPTPATGVWVQIVGVYDKANNYIYTQGVQRDSVAYSTLNITADNLLLGAYSTGDALNLEGQTALEEVDAWAWSPRDVWESFNREREFFPI